MKEGKDKFCGMTQTFVSVATGARRNIVKNERFLLDSETNVLSELRNTQRWISTGGTDGI